MSGNHYEQVAIQSYENNIDPRNQLECSMHARAPKLNAVHTANTDGTVWLTRMFLKIRQHWELIRALEDGGRNLMD